MTYTKPKTQVEKTASFRLPEMLLRKLDQHCADVDQTRSQLIRRLLKDYEPIKATQLPEPVLNNQIGGWLVGRR